LTAQKKTIKTKPPKHKKNKNPKKRKMIRTAKEAMSWQMRSELRARLASELDDAMLDAHLFSAYQRLAYAAHGDRRHIVPAAILARDVPTVAVDEESVLSLAQNLLGTRLDSVEYTPSEYGEKEPPRAAPVATRQTRRRELGGTAAAFWPMGVE
jgi:hypothetical protein